ncbi:MAG: outer membrane lipoprotein-sorting protein [Candidatus Kryptonium sp.]|nr:outer membrane lipoprotein-sorting protein [Candidatus Kryptonium sp.]MCX7762539.1 outer membrane lipoprotein-sorting protein [Candidatus Kryptonium sp.]MDW8108241.1 outer membrane lipoprotein-sorting protein [Candidatus Kryptonium sp.]
MRYLFLPIALLLFLNTSFAQLTAVEILKKVDEVSYSAKDQFYKSKVTLIDKNGRETYREALMYQKGTNKRLVKFTEPADIRGIGFLSLPDDVNYVYLPAFKKSRRIASHIKNQNFAGTDFTYEDMEALTYSEKWEPELLRKDDSYYVLKLTPRKGRTSDYSKLILYARVDNFYPEKIEYYDKAGNLHKILTRRKIQKIGNYWVALETEMKDIKKNHTTKLVLEDVKFDTNLSDDIFTVRNLER